MNISEIPCFGQRQGWCQNQSTHVLKTTNLLLHFCSECVEKEQVKSLAKRGTITKPATLNISTIPKEQHNDILLNAGLSIEIAANWKEGEIFLTAAKSLNSELNVIVLALKYKDGETFAYILEGENDGQKSSLDFARMAATFVNDYHNHLKRGGKPY